MQNFLKIYPYAFQNIFSLQGRVSRRVYFSYLATVIPLAYLMEYFIFKAGLGYGAGYLGSVLIGFGLTFAMGVRRLHDSGSSGKTFLFLLIPFIGVGIVLYLLLSVKEVDNSFGAYSDRVTLEIDPKLVVRLIPIFLVVSFMMMLLAGSQIDKIDGKPGSKEEFKGGKIVDMAIQGLLDQSVDSIIREAMAQGSLSEEGVVSKEILLHAIEYGNLPVGSIYQEVSDGYYIEYKSATVTLAIDKSDPRKVIKFAL